MPTQIDFMPPRWMRPAMVQTGLASLKFRKRGRTALENNSRDEIITTPEGVRLKIVTSDNVDKTRPIVILIHGWEGSSDSTYVVSTARRVFDSGCSVVRLNLRDHGGTHALNEGPFYATLFDEVFDGLSIIAKRYPNRALILAGFSLGGNYVLRTARRLAQTAVPNLSHLIAVSPVVDPPSSNAVLDENWLIKSYFLKKWKASLRAKQAAFPALYDFSDMLAMNDTMAMSEIAIRKYTDYPDTMTYFEAYGVKPHEVKDCPVPLTIIAAADDPVVPMEKCHSLELNAQSQLIMWPYGGHNGFFKSLTGPTGYDEVIAEIIDKV